MRFSIPILLLALLVIDSYGERMEKKKLIMLNERNVVTLRGVIDSKSTAKFLHDIMMIESDDIFIHMITPGGSVTHGHQLINVIEALTDIGKNIYCIADMTASMGFAILQSCPTRYVRTNSMLMQHQMSLGLKGPIEQIRTRLNFTNQIEDVIDKLQYERLRMEKKDFLALTMNDWWLYGKEAVNYNVADELVNVLCSTSLTTHVTTETVNTIFGSFDLVYSSCPLIWDPLEIKTHNINDKSGFTKYLDENREKYYLSQYVQQKSGITY